MLKLIWPLFLTAVFVTGCKKKEAPEPAVTESAPAAAVKLEPVRPSTLTYAFGGICYLDSDGKAKCFDANDKCIRKPPEGQFASISGTEEYACTLDKNGNLSCWGRGQIEPPIKRALQVSVAKPHSCALAEDGRAVCWGRDYHGSLKVPSGEFIQIAVGHSHTCALRPDKTVVCWGWNTSGQTRAPAGKFESIEADLQKSCGIRPDGKLVCWGMDSEVPPGSFKQVALEGFRACALRSDAKVVCWGYNWDGFVEVPGGPYTEVANMCARTEAGQIVCFQPDGKTYGDDGQTRYADADGSCGPPKASGPPPTGPAPRRPWIKEAMQLVRSHDASALSDARELVEKQDLRAFAEDYTKLTKWDDKMYLVYLVQDHNAPELTGMMKDFLSHPDCSDEQCRWSLAVALSFLDGNSGNFSEYFDNPEVAKKRAAQLRKTF